MPGSNFNNPLTIDSKGRVFPTGPATPAKGATDVEYYIWVQQPQAFMVCEAELKDGTGWVMKPETAEYKGWFVPGPAVGSGMEVSMRDGQVTTFWWGEQLNLV